MSIDKEAASMSVLYSKIAKVKAEMEAVVKSATNPFHRSKYADLNSHLDTVEPLFIKYGLVLTQPILANLQAGSFYNVLKTEITCKDTTAQISSMLVLPKIDDMQKIGSAITYARRYTLGALLAMQTEDDDANAASIKGAKTVVAKSNNNAIKDF